MSSKRTGVTAEDVQKWRDEAMQEWLEENATEAKVKTQVRRLLDARLEQIVTMALGFSKDSWRGNWEVDHCNGRAGESIAGDVIRKAAAVEVKAWLGEAMAKMPKPSPAISKALRREYNDALRQAVRDHVRAVAAREGMNLAASIVGAEADE